MNDDTAPTPEPYLDSDAPADDALGDSLAAHLSRRARTVHAPHDAPTAASLRRAASERMADRHHRRVAAVSMSGAAAVALVVALVVNAQAPQQVDTLDEFAAPPSAGGVATGSSTGSATGAAKGWSNRPVPLQGFRPVTLTLAGTDLDDLSNAWASTASQGQGRDAPHIAVLADLREGASTRLLVASPQSSEHLTLGKGGRELTIAGRPARAILVGDHGWQKIIWSMDEDTNVLLQSFGLEVAEIEQLAITLTSDGEGRWTMDPGTSGLEPVQTSPPSAQTELNVAWTGGPFDSPTSQTVLKQVDGGDYEFWASLVNNYDAYSTDVRGIRVGLPDGSSTTGVLTTHDNSYGNWARLTVLDPSGTVFTVERHHWSSEDAPPTLPVAGDELAAAAADLFEPLDDEAWADLLERAQDSTEQRRLLEEREADGRDGVPTTQPGAPTPNADPERDPDVTTTQPAPGSATSGTEAPTTAAPTTAAPTTERPPSTTTTVAP